MIAHRFGGRLIEGMPSRTIDLHPHLAGAIDSWNTLREVERAGVFEAVHRRVDELAQKRAKGGAHGINRDHSARHDRPDAGD
jgi:hypothetical protein